jgi:hypothetical protein
MMPVMETVTEPRRGAHPLGQTARARSLAPVGYLCALLLTVIPVGEAVTAMYPWNPGSTQWRFGAAGLFTRALLIPLLGLCIAAGVALVMRHRRTLRGLSILSGVVCVMLLGMAVMFILDAIQSSSIAQGAIRATFWIASLNALVKLFGVAIACGVLAFCGWRASMKASEERREVNTVW